MRAYDYEKQRWLDGVEGAGMRRKQVMKELTLLESPQAEEYLRLTTAKGKAVPTVAEEQARCRDELARIDNWFAKYAEAIAS